MAIYTADVTWTLRDGEDFLRGRYSRGHTVCFDGGIAVPASASPHVVGKWAVEAAVDPGRNVGSGALAWSPDDLVGVASGCQTEIDDGPLLAVDHSKAAIPDSASACHSGA